MGLLRDILDELYDIYLMYCEDCKKEFKTKRGSLIGEDHNVIYTSCVYCGFNNTHRVFKRG